MNLHEVNKMREEREHEMRHGHLSKHDREKVAYHRMRPGGWPDEKGYHSPEENEGIDQNAHGVELQ